MIAGSIPGFIVAVSAFRTMSYAKAATYGAAELSVF